MPGLPLQRTPKGLSEDAQAEAARRLRTVVDDQRDLHLSTIAAAVGRDKSVAEDWANNRKPFPVWVLAHPNVLRPVMARLHRLTGEWVAQHGGTEARVS